jgi:hypothetical protein
MFFLDDNEVLDIAPAPFPSKQVLEPNLLVPGKKPTGPVTINISNEMAKSIFDYTLFRNNDLTLRGQNRFLSATIHSGSSIVADYLNSTGVVGSSDRDGFTINTAAANYEQSTGGAELFNGVTVQFRCKSAGYNLSRILSSDGKPTLYFLRSAPDTVILHGGVGVVVQATVPGLDLTDGKWHTISYHYRGRSPGTPAVLAIDGQWAFTGTVGNEYNPFCNYWFGAYYSNGAYTAGLQFKLVVFHKWRTQYSAAEMLRYSANPYQFLIPA